MQNHTPPDYLCPFCLIVSSGGDKLTQPSDIVYKDKYTTAFIAPKWWLNNPGHVLVIPNIHSENIYDTPNEMLSRIYTTTRTIAVAMRQSYECSGISTRQHNEPAGGQDVWHMHVHVFPRYENDRLYENDTLTRLAEAHEKTEFANKLRTAIEI